MAHSALFTTEKKYERPILIVDKKGIIGGALLEKLQTESVVVFVSKILPPFSQSIVHVPFSKDFPTIPDNSYSHMILIDDDSVFTKKTIENFLKKANKDSSFVFFGVNEKNLDEKLVLEISSIYKNAIIGSFGEIFSKDEIYNKDTTINKFINDIRVYRKINIQNDGTLEISPVFLDDTIGAIIEICFGQSSEKIYYLKPKQQTTLLTLASIFKKINPEIKIDFFKTKEKMQTKKTLSAGEYFFKDKYNLEEKIKKINLEQVEDLKEKQNNHKHQGKPIFLTIFVFLVMLLFLPIFSIIIFFNLGQALSSYVSLDAKNEQAKNVNTVSYLGLKAYEIAGYSLGILKQELVVFRVSELVNGLEEDILIKTNTINTVYSFSDSVNKLKPILLGYSSLSFSDFSKMTVGFKNAIYLYNQNANLKTNEYFLNNNAADVINIVSSTIDTWPEVFGFNKTKSYLIVFQDNTLLRPSGGIINYYAVVSLQNGKVKDFKFYKASESDAKLTTHIEPPFSIRRYLALKHGDLRNSSFSVDFPKTAQALVIFLNAEEQKQVDGVISMDLYFVQSLLKLTGPVKLSDGSGVVTYENFFSVFGNHQESNFFKIVLQSLSLKMSNQNTISSLALLNVVSQAMYEKHLLFAFNDNGQEAIFAINGFSSALVDDRVSQENTINDFVSVSESNFSENNINFYVSRSLSQKINLEKDGSISESLTLAINNSSPTENFYKNYLRFILPENSQIKSILVDGVEQKITPAITDPSIYEAKSFKQPQALEVSREIESNKDIVGFLVTVAPQELKKVVINYKLSEKINLSKSDYKYSLKIFKQPGINFYHYDFSFNYLTGFKMTKASTGINVVEVIGEFSTNIYKDTMLEINFSPK